MNPLDALLERCLLEIERRGEIAAEFRPSLTAGAAAFRSALGSATPLASTRESVPAVDALDGLSPSPIADAVVAASDEIPWTTSPRLADGGRDIALGRIDAARDLDGIGCGLMLVRPGAVYPEHAHPPDELYLPITGVDARWRFGGRGDYRPLGPDELVYNPPNGTHGTVAGSEPVLALWVLW